MQGRARARRNALRHGLSIPVYSDPAWSAELEALEREIAGTDASAEMQEVAPRIAEAWIDLCRVRRARQRLLSSALGDPNYAALADERQMLKLAIKAAKRSGQLALAPRPPPRPFDILHKTLRPYLIWLGARPADPLPEGAQKFATILSDISNELTAMDRYERRALSRRNLAIRAFDAARKRTPQSS
jgi:hypothetical protein